MIFFRLFSSCLLSNTLSFGPRRPHTPRDSVPTLHLLLLVLLASSPVAVASPVAHWTLDDGSGSSVLDLSGNGLHGQLSGTTQWLANGAMDGALDLVAPGHVRVTDSGSGSPLDLAHELTLLVWVKPAGTGGTQSFISKDNVYELEMGHGGADRYSVRLANLRQGRGGTPLVVGAWQHVGVVWNGAQVTYFYNGRVDGADPYSGTLPANDAPLGLGGRPGASPGSVQYGLAGALDDVRIYNRALSEAEIRSIHAGGEPSPGGEDTTPPTLSNGAPTGVLAAGTTWVDLTWITSESAECRFDSVPGRPFGVMAFPFDVTGGSFHRTTVGGLSTGSHTFYARCRDLAGNANTDDAAVSFVIPAPGARPPLRSVAAPQGVLAAGTGGVPLTLTTDVAAECRYATDPGIPFADMPVTFQQTGGTSHSAPLAGLSDGFAYAYFVRCVDLVASGGANADDLAARVFVGTADEASFHPTDVSGLQFFVESRSGMTAATCDTESCRTAGDNAGLDQQYCDLSVFPQGCVRRWRDQSGFSPTGGFEPPEWTAGRDFGQDDLDKPGLIYDCIGGLPCARGGAGANQDRSFEIELGQEVGPVNGPFSAWILARPVVQPQDFYYWGFAGSELAHRVADDALSLRVAFGPGVVLTDPGAVTPGQWQLIEIHRAADDSVRAVVNGTDVTAGQPSTPGSFRFRFLMSVSRVHGMYGDMAAAMVFDRALGEAERQELRGYFSDVYGVGQGSGSGPRAEVPTDGLLASWTFEDTANACRVTNAAGAPGRRVPGCPGGGPTATFGKVGYGLDLDGSADGVLAGADPRLDSLTAFTVAAWIRHDGGTAGTFRGIFDKRDSSYDGLDLYLTHDSKLFARVDHFASTGSTVVADGQWHHVAATHDGDRLLLWVDGVVEAGRLTGPISLDTEGPAVLGRNFLGSTNHFDGALDQVRVYGRALDASEIAALVAEE